MNKTISVIVPVYNVEAYLPQCMESLLSQSYQALEIILIDDGSTDGSGALCDVYGAKDPRVRVIHKENGGAASAKNAGLCVATGEYLSFVDSDDYLEPGAYAFLLEQMEAYEADIVQSGYRDVFPDRAVNCVTSAEVCKYQAPEYLRRFTKDWTCALLWDKLYKRSLFDGIFFEEGHIIDDEFFTYQGVMNARLVVFVPHIVYNYRQRRSGAMLAPTSGCRIVMDRLTYLQQRREKVRSKFPELKRDFDVNFLDMMLILADSPFATKESLRCQKNMLRSYLREAGRTFPPKELWVGLLRLRFQSVRGLQKRKVANQSASQTQCLFD